MSPTDPLQHSAEVCRYNHFSNSVAQLAFLAEQNRVWAHQNEEQRSRVELLWKCCARCWRSRRDNYTFPGSSFTAIFCLEDHTAPLQHLLCTRSAKCCASFCHFCFISAFLPPSTVTHAKASCRSMIHLFTVSVS